MPMKPKTLLDIIQEKADDCAFFLEAMHENDPTFKIEMGREQAYRDVINMLKDLTKENNKSY